jgi:primary-amine oxidase
VYLEFVMSICRTGPLLILGFTCLLPLHGAVQRKQETVERPNGPLVAEGNRVTWEGWTFNWSIHPTNGMVLENVAFRGKSVLKYAGLAEIFVPYNRGYPRPEDFGAGIGDRLIELFPGKDCIPNSLGCQAFNEKGKAEGKRVVMLHEESTGLSYVGNLGRAYGKMLVLWCAYNLDGYFYISRWRFRSDGCLMPEIGLTGPLQHTGNGDPSAYGSLVGKDKVFAPSHVHNIYYCLDFDIDGTDNVVEEFNYQQDKPGSLSGKHSWTPIKKETSRPGSADNFRSWRVVNPKSKNDLGLPRSYELIPSGTGIYRGGHKEKFAQAELWVVRQNPKEHPNDYRRLSVALPGYLNDEDVEGKNVVLFYALHLHHLPRTEDWPGMPVEWAGFTLKPRDFLDRSPVHPK